DAQVRARIDRGTEDSISNLILYGTSYTNLPRLESAESALSPSGSLSAAALDRVRVFVAALSAQSLNERISIAQEFLKRRGVSRDATERFLVDNLRRLASEQAAYQQKLIEAQRSGDIDQKL